MANKKPSKIWDVFELSNNGRLRQILEKESVDKETTQALIDLISREEHRLIRLIESRKK